MRCKTQTFPILLIALFLVISLSIVGFSVAGDELNEDNQFELENWSISQELVRPGEDVEIAGNVTNNGEDGTDVEVILYIEGEAEKRKEEFVGSGRSERINFSYSEEEEGVYAVSIGLKDYDVSWDEGEFRVEEVTQVKIEPNEDMVITAGDSLEFEAEARDQNEEIIQDDDTKFTWENTDESGDFDNTEAGEYVVSATYNGVRSPTINVTVEPGEPAKLEIIQEPSEGSITAGETAEYTVQVQDEFGNNQTEGSFRVALEVDGVEPRRRHDTEIKEGESEATLDWSATTDRQGEYKLEVIEIENDDNHLDKAETTLTIREEEEDSMLAGQWWMFPLSIVVIAAISLVYLSDMKKKNLSLNILSSFGRKKKPRTHEWKRNKEPDESSDETDDNL